MVQHSSLVNTGPVVSVGKLKCKTSNPTLDKCHMMSTVFGMYR